MRNYYTLLVTLLFLPLPFFAQVGINTTNPNATLDITSSNVATPNNDDGILIPRIDDFPVTPPTAAQDGMMVFATGNGSPSKGFYYWDNSIPNWVAVTNGSGSDVDWYGEGTTSAPTNINDDIYTLGNVAIGKNTADHPLDILASNESRGFNLALDDTGNMASTYGIFTSLTSNTTNGFYGIFNDLTSGMGSNRRWGIYNTITGILPIGVYNQVFGNATTGYGVYNQLVAGPGFESMGVYNEVEVLDDEFHYGTNNELLGAGNGDIYGTYNSLDVSGTGSQYGTFTEITGGGNSLQRGLNILINGSGTGLHDGVLTTLSGTGSGLQRGTLNYIDNTGNGGHEGTTNHLRGTGNGPQTATYNIIDNTGTASHLGVRNELSGTGSGFQYGNYTNISNSGNGGQYGTYNLLGGGGTGDHHGTYNSLIGTGTGDQYGSVSSIGNSGNGAHYAHKATTFGSGSGEHHGFYSDIIANGTGVNYGTRNYVHGAGTGNKYGSHNYIPAGDGGTHYGVYSEATKTGSFAGYFLGTLAIGTTTANTYSLPTSRGTANQIMQTDGAGITSWTDATAAVIHSINDLTDGKSDASGSSVFLGVIAGNNDDGNNRRNTGVGYAALSGGVTGEDNTAIGYGSLGSTGAATGNTAVGSFALGSNQDGFDNVGIGYASLGLNETGIGNVALGAFALNQNQLGHSNIGIGHSALRTNNGGLGNIGIGFEAAFLLDGGSHNLAIGASALHANTFSSENTIVGGQAAYNNQIGYSNTFLGASTGYNNISGHSNVFLGSYAGYNELGSERLYIENSNANANNALIYGEFDNNLLRINGDLEVNTGDVNVDAGTLFVDATNNRVGVNTNNPDYAFSVNGSANLNEGVGGAAVALRVNGFEALWFNGSYFSYGFGGTSNYFADPIAIGAAIPSFQLQLSTNSAAKPTSSAWTVASDQRLKENVHSFEDGLEVLEKINPVWFTYNGKAGMPSETGVGTIAQELQKVAPYMVKEWEYKSDGNATSEKYLGVDYGAMDFVLINAIKEQQEIIKTLEAKVSLLESRLEQLENNK